MLGKPLRFFNKVIDPQYKIEAEWGNIYITKFQGNPKEIKVRDFLLDGELYTLSSAIEIDAFHSELIKDIEGFEFYSWFFIKKNGTPEYINESEKSFTILLKRRYNGII